MTGLEGIIAKKITEDNIRDRICATLSVRHRGRPLERVASDIARKMYIEAVDILDTDADYRAISVNVANDIRSMSYATKRLENTAMELLKDKFEWL